MTILSTFYSVTQAKRTKCLEACLNISYMQLNGSVSYFVRLIGDTVPESTELFEHRLLT